MHVIFTDLQAGSCTMAARRVLAASMDDAVLIAGANLPTLLDFVFWPRERRRARGAPSRRAERGAPALTVTRGGRVTLELYRIDDRLIHGQVVVGWGQPLDVGFIVLVDDVVAASEWEQELYRMGVPRRWSALRHGRRRGAAARRLARRRAARHPAHGRHRDDGAPRRRGTASRR